MIKNKKVFWAAAFLIGWGFDFFYWKKPLGISFAIHILISVGTLIYLAQREDKRPAAGSLWVLGALLVFSFLTFIRQEPFTRALNHLTSLGLFAILLLTFRGGRWFHYSLVDYVAGGFKLFFQALILPIKLLMDKKGKEGENDKDQKTGSGPSFWKRIFPYLRGVVLALPILAVFAALFAAADPIFADRLQDLTEYLKLERLPEYIGRLVLIMIWTFLTGGLSLYAILKSKEESLIGEGDSWPPRFLGFTEAAIVLGSVNLLFFSFVFIQFRYFFGGESNITLQGYTYAEYARRGFGELLAAAFITLLLFMLLSSITNRESPREKKVFTGLTALLTVFIGVILVSSFQRLRLYEIAYGFTRLRTYAHICILWIGVLFLGILILEILHRWRHFTLAALITLIGFVITLNMINVDSFIAQRNFTRHGEDTPLDIHYLKGLSNDAVPQLIRLADSPRLATDQRRELSASLACRAALLRDRPPTWQGFIWSRYRAKLELSQNQSLWKDYLTYRENDVWYVLINGEREYCKPNIWD
ncbi:MAG: DUF4173 domain-containing protein [Anaerolineales bacterium]|nr:DUF4173 domain-containing protein [Anaerolineales bacterium]